MNQDQPLSPTQNATAGERETNIVTPGVTEEDASIVSSRDTPPHIREAIDVIENYKFDPDQDLQAREREERNRVASLMMFSSPGARNVELPKLRTEEWPYDKGKKPNPITIGTAVKLLAAAYAAIPCELEEAGVHGYAWMIEAQDKWEKREGINAGVTIVPPSKPTKVRVYDATAPYAQWEYADRMQEYTVYNHLVQEGKAKVIAWFGKELFVDLHKEGLLPSTVTPRELIDHLRGTYAKFSDNRRYMEEVDTAFNKPHNIKNPIEAYFMQLQDARTHAEMLGEPYTDERVMNRALKEFEKQYGKDSYKAENKWYEKPKADRNWDAFKVYWKDQVHRWETVSKRTSGNQAHLATEVQGLKASIEGLQAETRTLQEDNGTLSRQLEFHQAMQAQTTRTTERDDMSALTTMLEDIGRRVASSQQSGDGTGTTGSSTVERARELLLSARGRDPRSYCTLNNGKGKKFGSYCWNCGVNCTHWTRRCYELTDAQKKLYRMADFDDQMGGSTKFLDRKDKYQSDYGFDSL